ncbi:hypothetical protein UK23_30710 [Lentzea aerocolonigenes]|uniref:DUF4386 domain-containing protein n=1 Tax=Lentzea aerocolonigenes TaxID=68170 RepID=A0A0F0GRT9_LENAE|nr:hypothetical protein [Lentzea aerocolonigenes]KJK44118.1 hypothetical protein UK23_30710 [Lentzea aerocolonigenes]
MRWLLPIGPAAVAVLRLILPYDTTDDTATMLQKAQEHPDAMNWVIWLGFAGMLTLAPAVIWIARHIRDQAPKTTTAAAVLLVPAYVSLGLLVAQDAAALDGHTITHPALETAAWIFVAGHVIGTVLLGIAMWHAGLPKWAAAATAISQPLHLVAAVIIVSHGLDFVAWGLNAVAFAVVARNFGPDKASREGNTLFGRAAGLSRSA